jgi:hypothetical protein
MPLPSRDEILDYLHGYKCYVEFITQQGSLRKMVCSLRGDLIPDSNTPDSFRQKWLATVVVYAFDAKDWRSFRLDRLKLFRILNFPNDLGPPTDITFTDTP